MDDYSVRIFLHVLTMNTLLVLIYTLVRFFVLKKQRAVTLMNALVMLLCPILGPAYFLLGWIVYGAMFRSPVDLEDVIFSKTKTKSYSKADEERERNLVSLEEAIAVTDKQRTRELVMEIVRRDISHSLSTIALALNSEDSEVSHYGASVLQDALNDFRDNAHKLYQQFLLDKNPIHRCEDARDLIQCLKVVLDQKVLSSIEQKSYVCMLDEMATYLYEQDNLMSYELETAAVFLIQSEEYEKAFIWMQRAKELYPNALASYTIALKYYFARGEREAFFEELDALKHSDVVIDHDTLELIRTFEHP